MSREENRVAIGILLHDARARLDRTRRIFVGEKKQIRTSELNRVMKQVAGEQRLTPAALGMNHYQTG